MWVVIDIGSNTIRLVIYSVKEGRPHSMLNKKYAVGLAGYIDECNQIGQEGIQVLMEVLADIKTILDYIQPNRVFPFGTAALRNSTNGMEIVSMIWEKYGLQVQILTGEQEAIFDYYGARQDGIGSSGLLIDVGGGSTELTFFREQEIIKATSIPLGSLNLYKTYVDGLIPTPKEARQIKKAVSSFLRDIPLPMGELITQPIYSVGGTARAALKLMQERDACNDTNEYTRAQLKEFLRAIEDSPRELIHSIVRTSPDRVHTMVPGLLVFHTIAKYYKSVTFITSRFGVREGYLMHCLSEIRERGDTGEGAF